MQYFFVAAAVAASAVVAGPPAAAQPDGQLVFNNACRTCHTVKEGDNRLGPSLHGVVGRPSGAVEGVDYSSALADGAVTFDEATLDRFIENPDAVAPGNGMKPYAGITSAEDRAAIIDYLKRGG